MTGYVVGFMFIEPYSYESQVLLIKKERPEWQKGKLNGIGGHIEKDETAEDAMVREFEEETGFKTEKKDWRRFCSLRGIKKEYIVFFYVYIVKEKDREEIENSVITTTDEEVEFYYVDTLDHYNLIPNLKWLIPLALDKDELDNYVFDYGEN